MVVDKIEYLYINNPMFSKSIISKSILYYLHWHVVLIQNAANSSPTKLKTTNPWMLYVIFSKSTYSMCKSIITYKSIWIGQICTYYGSYYCDCTLTSFDDSTFQTFQDVAQNMGHCTIYHKHRIEYFSINNFIF